MRAVICTRYGPPEVLQVREVATPRPRSNEIGIRIRATAVTSSDTYIRGLRLPFTYRVLARVVLGVRAPRRAILGMVLAGDVDECGQEVRRFAQGDRIFGFDRRALGAYAEYVCWPENALLAHAPANLGYEEAAAIPFGGLLALYSLRRLHVRSGQRVLVYGASGAVGTAAVQLAAHLGAEVTGVASRANLELVRSLGASDTVDYLTEDFVDRGPVYDVIFDAVGKRRSRSAMRRADQALVAGGTLGSIDDGTPRFEEGDMTHLQELAEAGHLMPVIDRRYRLNEIVDAHRYVEAGHKRGNVVVAI